MSTILIAAAIAIAGCAQPPVTTILEDEDVRGSARPPAPPCGGGLDLTVSGYGASFGNTCVTRGLRANLRDEGVREVDGLNLTLWIPGESPDFRLRGVAIGLVAPRAARVEGAAVGLLGAMSDRTLYGLGAAGGLVRGSRMVGVQAGGVGILARARQLESERIPGHLAGLSASGLATLTSDGLDGLHLSGLAFISGGRLRGGFASGLVTLTRESIDGLQLSGLLTYAGGDIRGASLAGFAGIVGGSIHGLSASLISTAAGGDLVGVHGAGLVTYAEGSLTGIGVAGLGVFAEGEAWGALVGGLTVDGGVYDSLLPRLDLEVSPEAPPARLVGVQVGGLRVQARRLTGLSVAGLLVHGGEVDGLSVGAVTLARQFRRGVAIGLFHHAEELEGVLIGLVNHVPTNPAPFRWLPLINVGWR